MLIKVDMDPTTIKKIERLINQGAYSDIRQFLSIAISNQLEEEASNHADLIVNSNRASSGVTLANAALKTKLSADESTITNALGSNWRQQLLNLKLERTEIEPKPSDLIWYFYNRFFPAKIVIYQLARIMVTQQSNWIELGDLQVQSYEFAQEVATKLKNTELRAKIPRNKKLSTGLPSSSMELISLRGTARRKKDDKQLRGRTRFMDQIVGRYVPKKKTFSGACFDLGLIGIQHRSAISYVSLTELGKEFALLENPIIDKDSIESAFSDKEVQFIFHSIYNRFRLEKKIVEKIIERLKEESLTSHQIDQLFRNERPEFITEERIATMGRLSELQLVNWEIDSEGKSKYTLNREKLNIIS